MTMTDGRPAIKLIGVHGNPITQYDVVPRTYTPIREVIRGTGEVSIIAYSEYRVLPATPVNRRLLDLVRRHPNARWTAATPTMTRHRTGCSPDAERSRNTRQRP